MPNYSVDLIITNNGPAIKDGWVSTNQDGTILDLGTGIAPYGSEQLHGVLIPGFVNAHCHLELSYLRGRIAEKQGMTNFIRELITLRGLSSQLEQNEGMAEACDEMFHNGIVAVGDISNNAISAPIKETSRLHFHTFIELVGINDSIVETIIANGEILLPSFQTHKNTAGLTPHAPYSVSNSLLEKISELNSTEQLPLSIHLHESEDELQFCKYGTGPMADFFKSADIRFDSFPFSSETPIHRILKLLQHNKKLLFVHNTYITAEDICWAENQHRGLFWCFCPKANLYITNALPPIDLLYEHSKNITVGTDSLASNSTLNILDELKVITHSFPKIPFDALIQWSTINGARALNCEAKYGSIEKGKTPGLVLLENIDTKNPILTARVTLRRLL